jgi:hypothetical protein
MDYVRFIQIQYKELYDNELTQVKNLLSPSVSVPEVFKDKFFSRKNMENLLELKDIME